MAVNLWAVRLERPLTDRETAAMLAVLPPDRRERLLRIKREEKRREPLCAYWILRLALREQYHWREFPEIRASSQGKPYFPEFSTVQFNISHTDGAALVGIGDHPMGVDIEKIRPVSRPAMERVGDGTTEEAFFRSWVRREARTKCSGAGIGSMLRTETPLEEDEAYYELNIFRGYAAGVAVRGGEVPGAPKICTMDGLLGDIR